MGTVRANKGERGVRDIIEAALDQGYLLERKPGRAHSRLIPPTPDGMPVGIACSPSDTNYRHQIVRELRRSGFNWPVSDNPKEETVNDDEVTEQWAPIAHCKAEISNGGMCRHSGSKRIIKPAENGLVRVTNDAGYSVDKSVRGECRKAFGHPPIKRLHFPERYAPALEAAAVRAQTPDQDHWEPVLIEGVVEGYEVNEDAVVMAPKSRLKARKRLTVYSRARQGSAVNLKCTDGRQRMFRLDEIVLEAFETRPGPHWMPEHINDNEDDCRRSNLRWVEGSPAPEPTKETEPMPTQTIEPSVTLTAADVGAIAVSSVDDIVVGHTYTHPGTGLSVAVDGQGKMTLPQGAIIETAPIIVQLMMTAVSNWKRQQ